MSADAWRVAIRPKTLTVGATPVLVGTAVAAMLGGFRPLAAGLALVGALLLQIASNLANDVYDYRKGADTEERLGPVRATSSGLLTEQQMMRGLALCLAAALASGLLLTAVAGWPILAIGLAGMVSAVAYTGGPYPLGYNGLGDVFVLIFFGWAAVAGTTFAQTGTWEPTSFALGTALGAFGMAVLTVNNIRDRVGDAQVGKRTLPVRLGERRALQYHATIMGLPYAILMGLVVGGAVPVASLLAMVTAPGAWRLVRAVATTRGRGLNPLLGATAKLQAAYGLLLSVGILVG